MAKQERIVKDFAKWTGPYDDLAVCALFSKRLDILAAAVNSVNWTNKDNHLRVYMAILKKEHALWHAEALAREKKRDVVAFERGADDQADAT